MRRRYEILKFDMFVSIKLRFEVWHFQQHIIWDCACMSDHAFHLAEFWANHINTFGSFDGRWGHLHVSCPNIDLNKDDVSVCAEADSVVHGNVPELPIAHACYHPSCGQCDLSAKRGVVVAHVEELFGCGKREHLTGAPALEAPAIYSKLQDVAV